MSNTDTDPPTQTELLRAFAAVVASRGAQVRNLLPAGQAAALLQAVARFAPPAESEDSDQEEP
jgi:hypothetical protein